MSMEDPCGKCDKREWVTNSSTQVTYHHVSHCCACARSAMDRLSALRTAGDALATAANELRFAAGLSFAATGKGVKIRLAEAMQKYDAALAAWHKESKP